MEIFRGESGLYVSIGGPDVAGGGGGGGGGNRARDGDAARMVMGIPPPGVRGGAVAVADGVVAPVDGRGVLGVMARGVTGDESIS